MGGIMLVHKSHRPVAAQSGTLNGVDLGTSVAWSNNTYFDTYTSQGGLTTSSFAPTNSTCWQMFYAHQPLSIPADSVNRYGFATYTSGSNTVRFRFAISTTNNTIGSFTTAIETTTGSVNYTAGGFTERVPFLAVTIPQYRYFLVGMVAGPYYRVFKPLAANRTAQIGGVSYVTAFNTVYYKAHYDSSVTVPTQLGGTLASTQYDGYVPVTSFKFVV